MKLHSLRHIILAMVMASATVTTPLFASVKGWEPVKTDREDARQVIKDTDIEIKCAPGTVIVTTNHPVQIKIFTMLGRLVSSETAPAGTSQFQLTKGIYIVKAGLLTCKIAV